MGIRSFLKSERKKILTREMEGFYRRDVKISRECVILGCGILNILLGLILTVNYLNINQVIIKHYGKGNLRYDLNIKKKNEYKMYIELENFFQNHLKYTKSLSFDQIRGEATKNVSVCSPFDIEKSSSKIIYPCGIIANTFFQDEFSIKDKKIDINNITWNSHKNFIKPTKYTLNQITSPPLWKKYNEIPRLEKNVRLANWFDLSPFPTFRKLYGRVFLEEGIHIFEIDSSYSLAPKSVVFTETCWAGTRNFFLSNCLLISGFSMVLFCLLMKFK